MKSRPRLKKAILRKLAKVRLDVDSDGTISPVMIRLDPDGPGVSVASVERVDDRLAEVWYEVLTHDGDRLTLRLERESLSVELHTVETEWPERWGNWSCESP